MVSRAGFYYDTLFNGPRGVTQGDSMSPIIINIVVDVVICHWETVVVGDEAGSEGFRRAL